MKRKFHLLTLTIVALTMALVSCEETSEAGEYDNWRERNEAFIDSLQNVVDTGTDPNLKFLTDSRNQNGPRIFYKVKKTGDTTQERPKLNSTIKAYYRGEFINGTTFDYNFSDEEPNPEFDTPYEAVVNENVTGWIEALQWMRPGDRWQLFVPWQSAYGSAGRNAIPGYTTLIFDMILVSVEQY
ncbi:FKBP-type peptidyl-prolyl cis-trans isomerase [Bacteroides sp. OttesenSCG-928-E20]|nr:FKBP-type peptidyl-prolyl cis-trans isomerase [Bacteroides sp. OttesenSCG-928-E20]MDL2304179.1 FKBP-type peptidyl-prolyl cis-trans isomerase [Bacteroides sp. OttesenSCG-928-D19]